MACGQQAAKPPAFLSDLAPAQRADLFPALVSPLRLELGGKIMPGTDLTAVYASMDRQFGAVLSDTYTLLAKAPDQVSPGSGPIVKPSPVASTGPSTAVILLADATSGREYFYNKNFDHGEQFTGDGLTENAAGMAQMYAENGQVVLSEDIKDQGNKSYSETDSTVAVMGLKMAIKVEHCPDASGLSHGTLMFTLSASVQRTSANQTGRGSGTFVVKADLLGHVNDSATLTTYDLLNLDVHRGSSGTGSADWVGFSATGISLTGFNPAVDPGEVTSGQHSSATVNFHNVTMATVEKEVGLMARFALYHVGPVYKLAEQIWREGKCVDVAATKGPDPKSLGPGQTTKFTVEVHHKPDGARLDQPVVATGYHGKANPEGKPVAAPAQFTYTADGGKPTNYSVLLESTSRRGIGSLTLNLSHSYKLTITLVSGPSATGLPNTVPVTITGIVGPDPSGPFLSGPGELHGEGYTGSCTYNSGDIHEGWTDAGPITLAVTLKATDQGDGNMLLTIDTHGMLPLPSGTFPETGGTVTHNETYNDCGPRSGTMTIKAEPPPG